MLQAVINLVIISVQHPRAPKHTDRQIFASIGYASSLVGVIFYYMEGVADIFMQTNMFAYLLTKFLAMGLSLIGVLGSLIAVTRC